MAIVKNSGIGNLSGRKGDDVFRTRGKRTTVSARPRPYHYNPENQKNCISPKNKFGYASWFATFNNKIPEIKEIWKRSKLKGRDAYHRMMSYNIKRSDINRLTEKNVLTPPGLLLEVKEAAITGDSITAHLEILDGFLSAPLKALAVVYSFNPGKDRSIDYTLFAVMQEISESDPGMAFDLAFQLNRQCLNAVNHHQKWIIYFALVKDNDLNHIFWTSTAAASGTNEFYIQEINMPAKMDLFCNPCGYRFVRFK